MNPIRETHDRLNNQQTRKTYIDVKDKAAADFCKHLNFMVRILKEKNPRDDDIEDLVRRVNLVTSASSTVVIETAGPYFFKYREKILARNPDFFMNNDFSNDVKEVAQQHDVVDDINSAFEMIEKIKKSWKLYSMQEQQTLLMKNEEMLKCYARYLSSVKKLNEMSQ